MRTAVIGLFVYTFVTFLITGFWPIIADNVFDKLSFGLYNRAFFENVLVEAHGAIIDLLVVGVILYWFERKQNTTESIAEIKKDLQDLVFSRSPDTSYKTFGNVRKLLEKGVASIALSEANLSGLRVSDLNLIDSNLYAVNFSNSILENCSFVACKCDAAIFSGARLKRVIFKDVTLQRAKFQAANLQGADFSAAQIQNADFTNAILRSADFRGVDCTGINFKGADLRSANFIGASNLTPLMLQVAKDKRHVKISV